MVPRNSSNSSNSTAEALFLPARFLTWGAPYRPVALVVYLVATLEYY